MTLQGEVTLTGFTPIDLGSPPEPLLEDVVAYGKTIFQSSAWVEALFACTPMASHILHGAFSANGETFSCFLGRQSIRSPKIVGPRRYWFNETGHEPLDSIYPEYNDFLCDDEMAWETRVQALRSVIETIDDADELIIRNAREPLRSAAQSIADELGLGYQEYLVQPTYQIALDPIRASGKGYVASRGSSMRSKTRRSARFFEQDGPLKLVRARSVEEMAVAFKHLVRLHTDTWTSRGETGVYGNKALIDFHTRLMACAPQCVDLLTITAGEHVIGVLHNLVWAGRPANYQSGFHYDPDNKQMSPGYVCHALAADYYVDQGFHTYDLLGGVAHYKSRLANEGEQLTSICLTLPTARTKILTPLRALKSMLSRSTETHQT